MLLYDLETGVRIDSTVQKSILIGQEKNFEDLNFKAVCYSPDSVAQQFTYSTSDAGVATINTSGYLTGIGNGNVTITVSGNSQQKSVKVDVRPFEDDIYFLKNKEFGGHLQVDDDDQPNYDTIGAATEVWNFNGEAYQQWEITSLCNGYHKIVSVQSGLALSVDSETSHNDGALIVQKTYVGDTYQQWRITPTANGTFKIKARSSEGLTNDLVLTAGFSHTTTPDWTEGLEIEQRTYSNDSSYKDEWEVLQTYIVNFYGVSNEGHDHLSALSNIATNLMCTGYNNVTVKSGAMTSQQCKEDLLLTTVFSSRSHGTYVEYADSTIFTTGILLNDEENDTSRVFLFSHFWSNVSTGSSYLEDSEDYTNIDMVLFVGCDTARGGNGGRNLPTRIVDLGAKVAIGFSESIGCNSANIWIADFYGSLLSGSTVYEAVNVATSKTSETSPLRSVVVCGDGTYTLPMYLMEE